MNKKITVVINGKGGVGKDTLCEAAAVSYKTMNISSITPIKQIASENGWNGEKDNRSRKFLSDLKRLFTEYNDLPNSYLLAMHEKFLNSDADVLFVHIREVEEIRKFCDSVKDKVYTLLVLRHTEDMPKEAYGNASDDEVENMTYDIIFDNSQPIEQTAPEFVKLIGKLLTE